VSAPSHERRINAILCEKCEDVTLLPGPFGAETRAKAGCCFSEGGICEISLCDGIKVNNWIEVSNFQVDDVRKEGGG
jgi:hypothetical protein